MPTAVSPDEVKPFATAAAFERWLARNHAKSQGIWLRIYKKGAGKKTVTYAEALDVALCYGWIDGLKKSYDAESWIQRFTPRRARSVWSRINTGHAARLISAGRMQPAGLAQVEAAKRDGRWDSAYASPRDTTVPDDFLRALDRNKKAAATFETLSKANRFAIAYRLRDAKRPETRERRLKQFIEMLARGEKLYP